MESNPRFFFGVSRLFLLLRSASVFWDAAGVVVLLKRRGEEVAQSDEDDIPAVVGATDGAVAATIIKRCLPAAQVAANARRNISLNDEILRFLFTPEFGHARSTFVENEEHKGFRDLQSIKSVSGPCGKKSGKKN